MGVAERAKREGEGVGPAVVEAVEEEAVELDVAEVLQYANTAVLGPARGHADSISRMLTTLRRSLSS